uniref:Microtubule-associated protein 9 n=1 Tax=Melopsittacus undulatus TaxID=13146 RepID=A0A8V5FFW3_MELUD
MTKKYKFNTWILYTHTQLFVKPFQDELQKAITVHAAREQATEYSDDFESDKDNMINGKTKIFFVVVLPFLNLLLDHSLCESVDFIVQAFVIPSLDTCSRPSPQRRNMLKKVVLWKIDTLVSATVNGKVVNIFVSWYFYRSLFSAHLKKKVKAVPSATPVSSQYMGTLKVLEDKDVQKNSTEFNKADSLRAAVFQNWLEMKKHYLRESKRIEKEKAENLRNNIEQKEAVKREEAIASFEAWKRKKVREAKELRAKKKLEERKKSEAAEQNKDKSEAAQKAFEKWKEKKMEYLREQSRKEKQSESRKKKKEEELIAEKKRDSMSAVEKWYFSTGVWNIITTVGVLCPALGPPKKREVDLLEGVQRRPQRSSEAWSREGSEETLEQPSNT